jgi:hypothetical protein
MSLKHPSGARTVFVRFVIKCGEKIRDASNPAVGTFSNSKVTVLLSPSHHHSAPATIQKNRFSAASGIRFRAAAIQFST